MTDVAAPNSRVALSALCREIHASNVIAGWWSDLKTGESILATRNRPEMLMLAVSELAEAAEGIDLRPDDKLPHRAMFDVELGDFVIRQLDQIGAEVSLGAEMPAWDLICSSWLRPLAFSMNGMTASLLAMQISSIISY